LIFIQSRVDLYNTTGGGYQTEVTQGNFSKLRFATFGIFINYSQNGGNGI
jgi:hypothetical protein